MVKVELDSTLKKIEKQQQWCPFTIKFDEAATSQVKKQYDIS